MGLYISLLVSNINCVRLTLIMLTTTQDKFRKLFEGEGSEQCATNDDCYYPEVCCDRVAYKVCCPQGGLGAPIMEYVPIPIPVEEPGYNGMYGGGYGGQGGYGVV